MKNAKRTSQPKTNAQVLGSTDLAQVKGGLDSRPDWFSAVRRAFSANKLPTFAVR